jgi:hypothetical protein
MWSAYSIMCCFFASERITIIHIAATIKHVIKGITSGLVKKLISIPPISFGYQSLYFVF